MSSDETEAYRAVVPWMTTIMQRFGDFAIDTEALELAHRGDPIDVQPRVFDLLV